MLAALLLSVGVVAHHTEMSVGMGDLGAMPGMVHPAATGDGPHHGAVAAAQIACLAVFLAIAAVLARPGLIRLARGASNDGGAADRHRDGRAPSGAPQGPPGLPQLCVWRI